MQPEFLTLDDALQIHQHQISQYGGDPSLRDRGLLESALAMPRQAFGGQYVHDFPSGMAAAYPFHIVKSHPFVDGNKRAGLAAALTFLKLNGWDLRSDQTTTEQTVLEVVCGTMNKDQLTNWIGAAISPSKHS